MASRDVNSTEIAFPGPESQFPGLHRASRFRPSTTYRLPFTGVIRVGSLWGEGKKRGRSPAGLQCCSRPTPGPHRLIDVAGGGEPETSQNGWGATGGARPGTRSGRSACGRRARESPFRPFPLPVRCHWTVVQRCGRMGAQNGGHWPGFRRSGAPVKTQTWSAMGGIADRLRDAEYGRPQAYCRAVASFDSEVEKFLSRDREKRRVSLTSLVASLCKGSFICVFVGKSDRPMWLRVARRLTFEREVDT